MWPISLDYLTDEICQMNTQVSCIAHRQARMTSHAPSPSPSAEATLDDEDDADSSDDDEMTASE